MSKNIAIDLQKLIVYYLGEYKIYEYLHQTDPKNHTMNDYCKFLFNFEDFRNYSIVKADIISQKYKKAKINLVDKELLDLQLKNCLEILDHLEKIGDIEYKKSNYFETIIDYENELNSSLLLNFEVKFLKSKDKLSSHFYQDVESFKQNQFATIRAERNGFNFYTDDSGYSGFSGNFYGHGLWVLFLSILKEQHNSVKKDLYDNRQLYKIPKIIEQKY